MLKRIRYKLPVAVFMILKKKDQILLVKRATTGWMDGFYSLPAGSLDEGEEILKAAIRECKEEIGVDIKEQDVKLATTQHCKVENETWINFLFITETWTGKSKVCEPHKHSEVKWNSINELPENIIPYVRKALEDYLNNKIYSDYGWN